MPLRHPAVFAVLADLEISEGRWKRIEADLVAMDDPRRRALTRLARSIGDRGDFWDLVEKIRVAAREEHWTAPDLGPDFLHLGSAAAMRQEGRSMRNCLATMVPEAAAGGSTFFRWLGPEPVDVHLRRVESGWGLAALGAPRNAPLPRSATATVEELLRGALGEAALDPPALGADVLAIADIGRTHFDVATRRAISSVLWGVHRRKLKTNNACIFGAGHRYVQFCVNQRRRSLRGEIAAHKFCPENASWLTESAVDLLDRCAFRWPKPEQNFAREFAVRKRKDCDRLADFVCGLHHELWSHPASEPLSIGVIGEDESESEEGCRLGGCRWFSAGGATEIDGDVG